MEITHKLTMDLEMKEPTKQIEIPQGDVNTRKIRFLLTASKQPWIIPEDAAVLIRYRKPDDTEGEYDTMPDGTAAWTATDNVLTVTLAPQVLTVMGPVMLYASLRLGDQTLNTFAVVIRVQIPDAEAKRIDPSEDYFCITRVLSVPDHAEVDQYLSVAEVDTQGRVTRVKAVDAPTGKDGEPGADGVGVLSIRIEEVS